MGVNYVYIYSIKKSGYVWWGKRWGEILKPILVDIFSLIII